MGNTREMGWIDQSSEFIMMALYPYFNGLFKSLFNDCPSIINSKQGDGQKEERCETEQWAQEQAETEEIQKDLQESCQRVLRAAPQNPQQVEEDQQRRLENQRSHSLGQ